MSEPGAVHRINELVTEGQVYQAYCDGITDGALALLAPALGVEGTPDAQLLGNRLRVNIEWIDPITDEDLALARTLAERSRQRARDQR